MHGTARRQPPGLELADRSGGLRRPGRAPHGVAAGESRFSGGHSRLGFRRHAAHRGDADDHPVEARDADDHVQLRGHRAVEPLAQARHAPAGNPLAGDRGTLQQDQAQPRTVRAAEHDRHRLPGHQAGPRDQGVRRLPLQRRLPQGGIIRIIKNEKLRIKNGIRRQTFQSTGFSITHFKNPSLSQSPRRQFFIFNLIFYIF